jgi:oxygen-dependent protoporphyrinogen oxidase
MKRVVIIGGGIAGLARLSADANRADLAITLLKAILARRKSSPTRGQVRIEGGNAFLSLQPRGWAWRELGLENRLHGTNEKIRRTYVMRSNKLHELPEGLTGLIPSRFGPMVKTGLISPLGKLRMALDYVIPPHSPNGDESLAAFVERRLGRELYDRLIEPLMSGIYAGDGAQLSLRATFPQLRQTELEHGSLIKGMLAARKKVPPAPNGRHRSAFLTPTTGLAEIVEALEAKLSKAEIRLSTRAALVKAVSSGYNVILADGESLPADAVILAPLCHRRPDRRSRFSSPMRCAPSMSPPPPSPWLIP